jgi:hypothetical protein
LSGANVAVKVNVEPTSKLNEAVSRAIEVIPASLAAGFSSSSHDTLTKANVAIANMFAVNRNILFIFITV